MNSSSPSELSESIVNLLFLKISILSGLVKIVSKAILAMNYLLINVTTSSSFSILYMTSSFYLRLSKQHTQLSSPLSVKAPSSLFTLAKEVLASLFFSCPYDPSVSKILFLSFDSNGDPKMKATIVMKICPIEIRIDYKPPTSPRKSRVL